MTVTPTGLSDVICNDCVGCKICGKTKLHSRLELLGLQTFEKYKYGSCTSCCQNHSFV
jgi:hypothetical protein